MLIFNKITDTHHLKKNIFLSKLESGTNKIHEQQSSYLQIWNNHCSGCQRFSTWAVLLNYFNQLNVRRKIEFSTRNTHSVEYLQVYLPNTLLSDNVASSGFYRQGLCRLPRTSYHMNYEKKIFRGTYKLLTRILYRVRYFIVFGGYHFFEFYSEVRHRIEQLKTLKDL